MEHGNSMEQKWLNWDTTIIRRLADAFCSQAKASIGIGYAFLCAICFSTEDMIVNGIGQNFQPAFIFVCNSVTALILCVTFCIIFRLKWRLETHVQLALLVLHGQCYCVSQISTAYAIFSIGPWNTMAMAFTLTIFSTIFSAVFLRSIPSIKDLLLVICSTGGEALISLSLEQEVVSKKGFNPQSTVYGLIAAVLSALSISGMLVVGRKLVFDETSQALANVLVSYSCQFTVMSVPFCALLDGWSVPRTPTDIIALLATGLTSSGGMVLGYLAVCKEKPIIVSIILTSEIVLTYVGQCVFFTSDYLYWEIVVGSLLIVISCIGAVLTVLNKKEDAIDDDVRRNSEEIDDEHQPILE